MTEHVRKKRYRQARATARAPADSYELEAEAIKALAHPKRLLILDLLSDGAEHGFGELMEEAGLRQSNLSQNLAVMRAAGLVTARRDGNVVHYRLADPRVMKAITLVRAVMEEQLQNRQFLIERAATKQKERLRRASTFAVVFLLAAAGAAAFAAAAHPLAVGGGIEDVGSHVQLMLTSGDIGTAWVVCESVLTEPMPAMAGPAARTPM